MRSLTNQARNSRPTISKIILALAVASVMGAMSITPALGENRKGHQDQGLHKGQHKGKDVREQPEYVYRPVYQGAYRYSQPVYVPPPVYYEPQPSPGISLFLPLDIRF